MTKNTGKRLQHSTTSYCRILDRREKKLHRDIEAKARREIVTHSSPIDCGSYELDNFDVLQAVAEEIHRAA